MAGSCFGKYFTVTTWGESHGRALGAVVDGCPAGLSLCEADIQTYLDRRKPGASRFSTPRREADAVQILSGVFEGRTTGTPISLLVPNTSQRSSDYSEIASYYRPMTPNTASGTTGAADDPPAGKRWGAWPPAPSPPGS